MAFFGLLGDQSNPSNPNPNADPNGGILGLLGRLGNPAALYEGALSDPATQQAMAGRGLLAMAGSFADSAMPTRMPTPIGAVLGHAAAALGTSDDAAIAARLQAAQGKQALGIAALTQNKADLIKTIGPDQAAFDRMDAGGGIASAPPPGSVPGTLGTPAVPTASVNTGRGPDGVIIPPGTPTATHDPKLSGTDNLGNLARAAAPIALPSGYTMEVVSGNRPGATVAGTGGPSQHANANAIDIRIKRPDGSEVKNDGPDTEGVYGRVAVVMRAIADPSIKPWLAWGGNFGKADIMHFDYAGDRGTAGSLAAMEKNLVAPPRPVQVAQANTGTMTDAVPPGMAAAARAAPPGLLGPSGQTIPQLADQAIAARPPAPPGLLNAPPPGAAPAPISPETIATLRAAGATDAEIARIVAAPPGPQVAASGPPPQIPAGRPPSLIPPPPAAPTVPPIAMPQVAAAPPPAAGPVIPGAPSPAKIAAAQRLAWKYTMAGLTVPADVAATATFGLDVAKAVGTAAGTAPIDVQKAIDIAKGTLGPDIAKARAGPAESGTQARTTYGDEMVEIPGLGWTQRKNLPGFTMAGGGGGGATLPPAAGGGPGTPAPGPSPAAGGPVVLAPSTTPAQAKLFESNLAQATAQLTPLRAEGLAAPTEIGRADEINDLLGRTKMGWGADTRQRGGMILSALGATPEQIKNFLGVDTTAGATLNKLFLQFSSDAVLRLGSREAASVLGQFAKAYPSLESDPRAAELMTNALRMQAQWKLDRANAAEAWDLNQQKNMGQFGQNYRGMNGFHEAFNKTNDFNDYWRAAAAMSGFSDIAWRGTSEADQHRILALIPTGRVHLDPSGGSRQK